MKRLVVAAMALLALLSVIALSACGEKVPAGAIAAVGDGVVTEEQYDDILAQAKTSYEVNNAEFPGADTTEFKQLKASIVEYLVRAELFTQQAKELGVEVTEEEIDERVASIVESLGGQEEFDKLIKEQKLTTAQVREQLATALLAEQLEEEVGKSVTVSEDAARKYYDDADHKAEFVVADTVDARHVLVKTKAKALEVRALLAADSSDANWKKVATKYSTDPGSKSTGGDLGSFAKDRMVEEFANAAFSLKVGQISQPVKTQFGYHVIEVTKKTPGSTTSFEDAKAGIEETLKTEQATKAWEEWVKNLESETKVSYAPGFDPDELTASPSPAAISASPSVAPSASPSAAE